MSEILKDASDRYFLNLQNDIDIRNAEIKNGREYDQIQRYQLV